MSELKEHLFVPYIELQEGDELTDAFTIAKSYYLKSEADNVIAELEESHKKEVGQLLMKIAELEKLVETADKLVKQKGDFTVKDIKFKGVKLEGLKNEP